MHWDMFDHELQGCYSKASVKYSDFISIFASLALPQLLRERFVI